MICSHGNNTRFQQFASIGLYKCNECGVIFTDRYTKMGDPQVLYEQYYKNEMAARFGFGIEYIIRAFRFFRALKIFTIDPNAKTILDIGSGRGFTLYFLKKIYKFKRTAGTQISKNAYEFSHDKLGLEIYNKDLLDLSLPDGSFDIITMWHVLEHVKNPEGYIEKISGLLRDGGRLAIEVPNFNSWTRNLTDKYWLGLDLNYHLTFYTPGSLSLLLEKYQLKVKAVRSFSLEYSTFISAQSIISLITRSDHIFFRSLQADRFNLWVIPHIILFVCFMPVCFLVNILFYFSGKGEVIFIIAEKEIKHGGNILYKGNKDAN